MRHYIAHGLKHAAWGSILALVLSSAAHATTYVITYKGEGAYEDPTGVFGPAGKFTGNFTVTYRLKVPAEGAIIMSDGSNSWISGSNLMTASIVINGVTLDKFEHVSPFTIGDISQSFGHGIYTDQLSYSIVQLYQVDDRQIYNYLRNSIMVYSMLASADFTDSLDYTYDPGAQLTDGFDLNGGSGFYFSDYNMLTNSFEYEVSGGFTNFSVSIAPLAAVPEPGAWVMLSLGFGLVGALARRRNKVKTTAIFA